jgi:hypothetical protein
MQIEAHPAPYRKKTMQFPKSLAVLATAALVGVATMSTARADSAPPVVVTSDTSPWSIEISPYTWLAGMKGDVAVRDTRVGIDQSFSEILKYVKFAGDLLGVARYNNWVLYTQVDYFSMSTTQLEDPPARGSLDSKQLFYTAGAGYRFGSTSDFSVDVLGGIQGIDVKHTLTFYGIGSAEKTRSAVDAMGMLRPAYSLGHWLFDATLSAGGGSGNKLYQLGGEVQYRFNRTWEARVGYRKLNYKFTGDRDNYLNLALSGPIIGFGATF